MMEQTEGSARIVDRGYQHYTGARLGPAHATRVMVAAALRRALGIRRSLGVKIAPWLLLLVAFAPSAFLLGVRLIIPGAARLPLPPYAALYNSLTILFVLFAAVVAPDLLCADRRQRVLSLYFAAPITRLHYIAAQFLGLLLLLLLMTLGPMLLLFAGNALLAASAGAYVQHHLDDLREIAVAGGLLALYYSALAMAVASFTDRLAYATGAYLGLLLVSAAASAILAQTLGRRGHEWVELLGLITVPLRTAGSVLNQNVSDPISVWVYLAVTLGVIAVSLGVLVWRYMRMRD